VTNVQNGNAVLCPRGSLFEAGELERIAGFRGDVQDEAKFASEVLSFPFFTCRLEVLFHQGELSLQLGCVLVPIPPE